jgi:hypothetical protein
LPISLLRMTEVSRETIDLYIANFFATDARET